MNSTSRNLTIFEGPDGGGKTTAAIDFAKSTGARYIHFSSLPHVSAGLARMYVEAMLPALLGYQDVVFDRCWLSEEPYGAAFRGGKYRLTSGQIRVLERLALRCGTIVVKCLPEWETVRKNYSSRREIEMLDNEDQLKMVYDLYSSQLTSLPAVLYDYQKAGALNPGVLDTFRSRSHPLSVGSAGHWWGKAVIVGEKFGERKDLDAHYQWPFGSFSRLGCSQWLASELDDAGVSERDLLWINADQDLRFLRGMNRVVVALGGRAYNELQKSKIMSIHVPHPQFWKRFNAGANYPLMDLLIRNTK